VESNAVAKYTFPEIEATILAILKDKKLVSISLKDRFSDELNFIENAEVSLQHGESVGLIFDRTNFSSEIEEKRFDKGHATVNGKRLLVSKLERYSDFTIHYVSLQGDER